MATNTFDRKIEITDIKMARKLADIMAEDEPIKPISNRPFSETERERSMALLKQCSLRSRR